MNSIQLYDPAMCCPTGVCGPSTDPELTRVASAVYKLENKGCLIKRFNLANEPGAFTEQPKVLALLEEKGPDILPVTLLNGEIYKTQTYPSNQEFAEIFGFDEREFVLQKPKITLDLHTEN
ncbi:arsenite efflux transporter metallochaperone ArsD [Bacillus mangrovi]|uniref:Arsenite efflux transporter metallochaperone ArsD n=1 Tax=Metabacillus mangrovi TaxID=1491830 RepID=A0A7X2S0Z8_9BACI|nr:arsenite efflux transporter metallochaperone ArsD [Metabacillus mangrovi]MTH51887.1 arsenite efflux transporter metallochaperone ArsD [Metabacillus mangrovi]